jgi:hypothetical protein
LERRQVVGGEVKNTPELGSELDPLSAESLAVGQNAISDGSAGKSDNSYFFD